MPVTKHKAASCRKFNVVAPRGGDKRGESFSQLSTVANFVDSRVKAVYGTAKEKSKSTRLVLGKVQLVRFTLKQRGESRNRLNPRKVRFLFFSPPLSSSFPLSLPGCILLSLSLKNLIPPCFVSFSLVSFRFNLVFNGVFSLQSQIILAQRGDRERRKIQFLKFFSRFRFLVIELMVRGVATTFL